MNALFVDIHSHQIHLQKDVLRVLNCYPHQVSLMTSVYSCGIHPWYVNADSLEDDVKLLNDLSNDKKMLMIGECGLDKSKHVPWGDQLNAFQAQILLAEQIQKPLIIHCVNAYNEVIDLHRQHHSVPWLIHGFNGHPQLAEQLCREGFYLSFGQKQITNPKTREALLKVPLSQIFFETDDTSDTIVETYGQAAVLLNLSVDQLKLNVQLNFERLLGCSSDTFISDVVL